MARFGGRVLPAAFVALALASICCLPSCFVPAVDRRAVLAAAAAAAVAGQQQQAEAAQARFSVFGFDGSGKGAVSDAYQQIDPDAISPYSQFSNPKDSEYTNNKDLQEKLYAKNKARVIEYVSMLDKVPELIQKKQSENLKSLLTTKLYSLREVMEYVTSKGAPFYRKNDAAGMKEADLFFQDLADLGVAGRERNWGWAAESYDKAKGSFLAWKNVVGI
ncbi:unnamed protein product [Prorocentrum cordatum]|uniref:Uncharacterized protein n=1 Tax=Prorocentrum cordatum TaxID=2364126 RepID=A0ABN9T535_9DINO|nr:unnamed protein product [Polarella glacialis]